MCLIIFSPKIEEAKNFIWKPVLDRGFRYNPHGAGFAYISNGAVKITKAYFDFDKFYKAYEEAIETATGPFMIHFRYATHGSHNFVNTQPIPINKGELVMAHNGVFSELSFDHLDISDSVYLSHMIRKLRWQLPLSNAQQDVLKALCANYSKLVFIDKEGKYKVINEHLGAWRNGSWYSDKGRCWQKFMPMRQSKTKTIHNNFQESFDDNDFRVGGAISENWQREVRKSRWFHTNNKSSKVYSTSVTPSLPSVYGDNRRTLRPMHVADNRFY